MLTYNELVTLKENLLKGDITLEKATSAYMAHYEAGKRSWHTKDWKERREEIIKEECQICSSKETLTIQHNFHPQSYYDYKKRVVKEFAAKHNETNPKIDRSQLEAYIAAGYEYKPIPLCPECGSRKPNERLRKKPKFLCTNCKSEFEEPAYKPAAEILDIFFQDEEHAEAKENCFFSIKYRKYQNLSSVRYWYLREHSTQKNEEAINKESFVRYLSENIRYLSFEGTITACRKCASFHDLHKMELCPICKTHYKGIQYQSCISCLPEHKRKQAEQKIAFGKEMGKMHEDLGID